jgi:hypothetical protein
MAAGDSEVAGGGPVGSCGGETCWCARRSCSRIDRCAVREVRVSGRTEYEDVGVM